MGWELQRALSGFTHITAPPHGVLDLASRPSIETLVRTTHPDLILNAAAYTAVDKAESEPEIATRINAVGPGILAEEANRAGAVLIHYSTDYVFDGEKPDPWREDDEVSPLNTYGRTKLAGEVAVASSGCPHLIFRTSWVYGPRGSNFFQTMRRLASERKELRVVNDQFGAPTTAHSIAGATARIVRNLMRDGALDKARFRELSGIYHMTASGRTTWYRFALEIMRAIPEPPQVVPIRSAEYPTPARRPSNSVLDNGKLQREFGVALDDWESGLRWCQLKVGTADYSPS